VETVNLTLLCRVSADDDHVLSFERQALLLRCSLQVQETDFVFSKYRKMTGANKPI
jgi:hypothetical protein